MWRLCVMLGAFVLAASAAGGAACAQEIDPALATPDESAPLPQDPRLFTRTLDNGLRVLVLPHASPPGRVQVWVRVGVGSLDERGDELAHARLAQEASLVGVRAGEWQAALDRLTRRGLNPDEAFGGRTRPDQTIFYLTLPDADDEALDAGMSLLSRVVFDATLGAGEVERARDLALQSLRAAGGAESRARTQWLAQLGGESLIGRRPPSGDEASVRAASGAGVLAFRAAWYTPGNTTVLVVGDVDGPAAAIAAERWFAPMGARKTPARQDRGAGGRAGRMAAIGSDPELGGSELALVRMGDPAGPVRTHGDLRRHLLEQSAIRALETRVRDAIAQGRLSAIEPSVYVADLYGAFHLTQVAASAPGDGWRGTLAELCAETQRVREHGFTRAETGEAIAGLITRLEEYTQRERAMPSGEVMRWLNYNDAAGHVWMQMETELALARRILLGVEAAELTRVFREVMPPGDESVIVTAPEPGITSREVLAIVERAMSAPSAPAPDPPPVAGLISRMPEGGAVVEISAHPPSGVWSAWLSNNVRVHHRRVPGSDGRVLVRATLGGGDGAGSGVDRELLAACAQAWASPSVEGVSSVQVRRLLADARVGVSARGGGETLTLEIDTSPEDLVTAFELAHRLLLDPVLEGPALERWRRGRLNTLLGAAHDPVARLDEGLGVFASRGVEFMEPGERIEGVRGVTLDDARAVLGAMVASAPLEVAIVGDVSGAEAFELGERYLGSLPTRARVTPTLGGDHDRVGFRLARVEEVETSTRVAGVLSGLRACPMSETPGGGRLAVAARVLQSRLNTTLREQRRIVSSVRCELRPGEAGVGGDVLSVRTACDPEHTDEVVGLIEGAIEELARRPAGESEIDTAASQIEGEYRDALATPEFWARSLGALDRRGLSLDDVVAALDARVSCTPEQVREAMESCRGSAMWLTLVTRPAE